MTCLYQACQNVLFKDICSFVDAAHVLDRICLSCPIYLNGQVLVKTLNVFHGNQAPSIMF